MALIKASSIPHCRDCHHIEESAQHALSWITRSRPGIKGRHVRAVKKATSFDLKSHQPHQTL